MSGIEHTRTLGKVHNTKILGLLIDPLKMTTADAGEYNSMTYYCGEV